MKSLILVKPMKKTFETISILSISFPTGKIQADLSDGRSVALPLSWFPKLNSANEEDLKRFEISVSGYGVHWNSLDEDISIKAFI